ncbi:YndJ family protein [Bacillus fonticola]|uniref:YndJ family protein n=1 Tax=Bacillus fonticola TaxID=2728853 RepID=UPI001475E1CF|nr:YndJ family protein [Bacillus fonticola]
MIGWIGFLLFVVVSFLMGAIRSIEYVEMMLVIAYGVFVPMGLRLFAPDADRWVAWLWRLHPIAFVATLVSFLLDRGLWSTVFSLPWFFWTALLSLYGLWTLWKRQAWRTLPELLLHIGPVYIVVGGMWLVLHRTGLDIMGFPDIIVLLTSIHFHYAAFVVPIVFGLALRAAGARLGKVASFLGSLVLVGPIFVALGITFGESLPWFEFFAVVELVVPIALLSFLFLWKWVPTLEDTRAKGLLIIGFGSLFVSMSFAFLYGYGHVHDGEELMFLSIPLMVFVHGMVNVFGFSLFTLLGMRRLRELGKV